MEAKNLVEKVTFRLFLPEKLAIEDIIINKKPEKYENFSHFCRVAILKLIWEEQKNKGKGGKYGKKHTKEKRK